MDEYEFKNIWKYMHNLFRISLRIASSYFKIMKSCFRIRIILFIDNSHLNYDVDVLNLYSRDITLVRNNDTIF